MTFNLPSLRRRIAAFRLLLMLLLGIAGILTVPQPAAYAAGATLTPMDESEMKESFRPHSQVLFHFRYQDPNGDTIRKSGALFVDEATSGNVSTPASSIEGDDTSKGVIITWNLTDLAEGHHSSHFEVKGLTTTTAYPAETGTAYQFVVETLSTKYIILGMGALVCFAGIPFITFFLFRMINPRGEPSRAARTGLLFGILAFCALFIFEFASVFGPLVYAILIIGVLGAVVLMAGGRR